MTRAPLTVAAWAIFVAAVVVAGTALSWDAPLVGMASPVVALPEVVYVRERVVVTVTFSPYPTRRPEPTRRPYQSPTPTSSPTPQWVICCDTEGEGE